METSRISSASVFCGLIGRHYKILQLVLFACLPISTLSAAPVVPVPETARGGGYIFENLAGWMVEAFTGSDDGFSGSGDGFFSGSDAGFSGSMDGFSGSGAGGGFIGNVDGVGGEAMFYRPGGVSVGADGTIYVSDTGNNVIRKIAANGMVSKLAGNFLGSADGGFTGSGDGGFLGSSDGIYSGSADGTGEAAGFKNPQGLALDKDGNILVADRKNHAIRKVTPDGVVTTIAGSFLGSGTEGLTGSSDGAALGARFNHPSDVVVDANGNIFVADAGNHAIRKIDTNGNVTTIAGSLGQSGAVSGSGSAPRFNSPQGIAIDADGNIIVADTTNGLIRKIAGNGTVSTIAGALFTTNAGAAFEGSGGEAFTGSEGEGGRSGISGAARDYFTGSMDAFNGSADAFSGSAEAFLGSDDMGWPQSVDGTGDQARFSFPTDVEVAGDGNIYVVDSGSGKVRKITPAGVVSTLGGTPDGFFYMPLDIAISQDGRLIVADSGNNRIAASGQNHPPEISLLGQNPMTVFKGSAFVDPGAVVTDDFDPIRTIVGTGSVDTNQLGSYVLTYSTKDLSDLEATLVTRSIEVILDPNGDEDGDGLSNRLEAELGSNPLAIDSDGDGFSDAVEYSFGSSLVNAGETPNSKRQGYKVITWGNNPFGASQIPSDLIDIIQVSAGWDHGLALRKDGTVVAWGGGSGANNHGQATVPEGLSNVVQIEAGSAVSVALKGDGTVVAWGANESGQTDVPPSLNNVVEVAAGAGFCVALKNDGRLVAWGTDFGNKTAVPENLTGVNQVAARWNNTLALKDNGSVASWGYWDLNVNDPATLPQGIQSLKQVAVGVSHALGIDSNNSIVTWGSENMLESLKNPPVNSGVIQIAAGYFHSLAITSQGTILAWGNNENGETFIPSAPYTYHQVSGGFGFSVALVSGGSTLPDTPTPTPANVGNAGGGGGGGIAQVQKSKKGKGKSSSAKKSSSSKQSASANKSKGGKKSSDNKSSGKKKSGGKKAKKN